MRAEPRLGEGLPGLTCAVPFHWISLPPCWTCDFPYSAPLMIKRVLTIINYSMVPDQIENSFGGARLDSFKLELWGRNDIKQSLPYTCRRVLYYS
jgi:hypothetical protein